METRITSPIMDDMIDNVTPEGTEHPFIDCDKCRYNRSCDLYERGVRVITHCNSYQLKEQ